MLINLVWNLLEIENNNSIPFWNFKIIRDKDGIILTDWYIKDTYSGTFINFLSNHPKKKAAIIKNLVDSATILSHPSFHKKNLTTINNTNNIPNNDTENNKLKKFVSIPYHGNILFTIRRILFDYNLETVFRVDSKLDNMIELGKDPLDKLDQSNVV